MRHNIDPSPVARRSASYTTAYTAITESRHKVLFPFVARLLEEASARSILDFGGGDGRFLAEYLAANPERAAYYDTCPEMIAQARARFSSPQCHMTVEFIDSLGNFSGKMFDAVTMLAVWMEITDEASCVRELSAVAGVLSPGGYLFAGVTHPCFRNAAFETHKAAFETKYYFNPGHPFCVVLSGYGSESSVMLNDVHWNLEAMSRQLHAAGFAISRLFELPESLDVKSKKIGSLWLVIEARKVT